MVHISKSLELFLILTLPRVKFESGYTQGARWLVGCVVLRLEDFRCKLLPVFTDYNETGTHD